MKALFSVLGAQIETNAKQAVEAYAREIAEYGSKPEGIYDFALFLRRRMLDLAPDNRPYTDDDLAAISAVGRRRAEEGLSLASQHQVLALHTSLVLREVHEAAADEDLDDLLRAVGWFGVQGVRARAAFLRGYLDGCGRPQARAIRLELLARALLADQPPEPYLVDGAGIRLSGPVTVSVLRPVSVHRDGAPAPHRLVAAWLTGDEYAVVTPGPGERALDQVRHAVEAIGRPCRIGSAEGKVGRLAAALALARQIGAVAPPQERPTRLYAMSDLFVEMSVAATPAVDVWLRDFGRRLAGGPSLVETLHAFYHHDMGRLTTAAALNIHPRTLDYRLRRVRDVTGVDPGSTLGIRILSAAVTRLRAA